MQYQNSPQERKTEGKKEKKKKEEKKFELIEQSRAEQKVRGALLFHSC